MIDGKNELIGVSLGYGLEDFLGVRRYWVLV
jgi:hypothetical protein